MNAPCFAHLFNIWTRGYKYSRHYLRHWLLSSALRRGCRFKCQQRYQDRADRPFFRAECPVILRQSLPTAFLLSDSGNHLQTRIWKWLRGRCVATNVLVSQLNRFPQAQVYSPVYGRGMNRSLDRQSASIPTQAPQQFY